MPWPVMLNTGGSYREQCRHCALVIEADNMRSFCGRSDHYTKGILARRALGPRTARPR